MLIEYVNRMSIELTDPDSCTLYKMSTGWGKITGQPIQETSVLQYWNRNGL